MGRRGRQNSGNPEILRILIQTKETVRIRIHRIREFSELGGRGGRILEILKF